MSLRKRAERAYVDSERDVSGVSVRADERLRAEVAARSRINRWCQRMGVTSTEMPPEISLERQFVSESGLTSGWFRFVVEDLDFWARADSTGQFSVFLAPSAPNDPPIEHLADLGRALAKRVSAST